MLTKCHPFVDLKLKGLTNNDHKLIIKQALINENIKVVDTEKPELKNLDEEALYLLQRLLDLDPAQRITAGRALKNSWIVNCGREVHIKNTKINEITNDVVNLNKVFNNVISIIKSPILKIILLDRMCNQSRYARIDGYPEVDKELLQIYRNLYNSLDLVGYGALSKKELANRMLNSKDS